MQRNRLHQSTFNLALAFCLMWALTPASGAASGQKRSAKGSLPIVDIPDFGKVNDHYYRGSQPGAAQYRELAALGVKTIVDLRDDPRKYAKSSAEQAGLRYINLPLNDKQRPPDDAAARFLEIATDQANWPIYVHCAGGRHRTGAMTAIYRMAVDGWDFDRAYAEMKQFDFYTRHGHMPYKIYVQDYYRTLAEARNWPK